MSYSRRGERLARYQPDPRYNPAVVAKEATCFDCEWLATGAEARERAHRHMKETQHAVYIVSEPAP